MIVIDSDRYQSYGFCTMETLTTVTRREEKSSRTAADSQPIPRLGTPSESVAGHLALRDAEKVVRWLNASKGTASHDRVLVIRRELEDLPSEFATHAGAYVHSSGGVLRLGEPPREKRRDWPKEKLKVQQRLHTRHVALNKALETYIFRPRATLVILGRAWIFGMVPDENKRSFQMRIADETISEADAVISLVRLAETGEHGKVRLCDMCKTRWRVAARKNYRFCSEQCREDFYAKAPDYHSRKAANQRRYRENLKRNQAAQNRF
jgi:hypothetical protein